MAKTEDVGEFGIARDGQMNRVAEGRIITHSIVPQVLIEGFDGRRSWHRHDMVRRAADDELLDLLHRAWDQRHLDEEWSTANPGLANEPTQPEEVTHE